MTNMEWDGKDEISPGGHWRILIMELCGSGSGGRKDEMDSTASHSDQGGRAVADVEAEVHFVRSDADMLGFSMLSVLAGSDELQDLGSQGSEGDGHRLFQILTDPKHPG
ncbi:hypothetical protein DUI87_17013 [Hirundo rustica rustica]|uniref:Uncharacterized protein n=1 Tax=Hirundo rustica rustica TaxID=333673 RepID=A0A3M0K2M4_HIRRU|nr:hypothetical protein DUI87_17013 [Hirundo rustica rustica]